MRGNFFEQLTNIRQSLLLPDCTYMNFIFISTLCNYFTNIYKVNLLKTFSYQNYPLLFSFEVETIFFSTETNELLQLLQEICSPRRCQLEKCIYAHCRLQSYLLKPIFGSIDRLYQGMAISARFHPYFLYSRTDT